MYLSLERDEIVPESGIIGIFDLDNISWSYLTREYLSASEKSGRLKNISGYFPRTLVVTTGRDYLSSLVVPRVLERRIPERGGSGIGADTDTDEE
ncbi:MAG: DUF370 domain-containing protein [Oscillospiraceae bacterium]|jgi:hypothetical protein|nr:DUF370 domain-containing protein [Oscillospiraceae bacterium]